MESIQVKRAFMGCAATACAMLAACAFMPQLASAASAENVELGSCYIPNDGVGFTVGAYDITGDEQTDTVVFTASDKESDGYYRTINIKVNGQKAAAINLPYAVCDYSAKLLRTKSGATFVSVDAGAGASDQALGAIYKYKSGKLVKMLDCLKSTRMYVFASNYNIEAKSDRIVVKYSTCPRGIGLVTYACSYRYKGGKLKTASTTTNFDCHKLVAYKSIPIKELTAAKNIQLYKNAKCTKKASMLKRGQEATFKRLSPGKKVWSFKVKTSAGKTGWLKVSTKTAQFKNLVYVG